MTPIFHLSLPVSDLEKSRAFYEDVLGGVVGRVTERWLDVWIFKGQVTLQQSNGAVAPPGGKFHFGGTLDWDQWKETSEGLKASAPLQAPPVIDDEKGVAKLYLTDPDGYVVEVKAYRDVAATLQPPSS